MQHFPEARLYALFICLTLVLLFFTGAAHATLGESISSLESNRAALKAVQKSITTRNTYTVHEDSSDGANVRQYVSSDGIVFAVAWNGVSHPDLASLLGKYYDDYSQVQQKTPRQRGKRHVQVRGSRVIVERWGHMRNLQGRAYAPALLPGEVNLDEIR